jgi:NADPH-dependent curcumin reductase CurA
MTGNRQIVIQTLPTDRLGEEHFKSVDSPMPTIGDGQVLVRSKLLSLDAANRAWMQGATYREAVKAGDVMHGYSLGEVVESKAAGFAKGDKVFGEGGWQQYYAMDAKKLEKARDYEPVSHLLSLIGIAGKTAYHGLIKVGRPKAGETVVVSAAAGSVGVFVGQIAKALGCRAVGIAGGPEKCQWLVDELGFDAAVDYKAKSFRKDLAAATPQGIDVFFDNVGGPVLEAALFMMNQRGRIVCCGAVSQYDTSNMQSPRGVPGLLVVKRLRMEGFIVMDFADQDKEAEDKLLGWAKAGKIKTVEDIIDGLENAPKGLIGLLAGENRGKRMVRV